MAQMPGPTRRGVTNSTRKPVTDFASAIAISFLAISIACALVFGIAKAEKRSQIEAEERKALMTFTINMTRLNFAEWQRLALRTAIPSVDAAIAEIQSSEGVDRATAAMLHAERMMQQIPDDIAKDG